MKRSFKWHLIGCANHLSLQCIILIMKICDHVTDLCTMSYTVLECTPLTYKGIFKIACCVGLVAASYILWLPRLFTASKDHFMWLAYPIHIHVITLCDDSKMKKCLIMHCSAYIPIIKQHMIVLYSDGDCLCPVFLYRAPVTMQGADVWCIIN